LRTTFSSSRPAVRHRAQAAAQPSGVAGREIANSLAQYFLKLTHVRAALPRTAAHPEVDPPDGFARETSPDEEGVRQAQRKWIIALHPYRGEDSATGQPVRIGQRDE
jgi:hypothetical protein